MSCWQRRRWAARVLAAAMGLAGGASARGASLSIEEGAVVLGKTESTAVLIRVDERPGTEELPLQLAVNVGRFSQPVRLGPGRYRAVYLPPPTRFPQVALVAVWRETGPDAPIDFLRIPLLGLTRVPVAARPGAAVSVRVGRETFGPVAVDRQGRVEVPVAVPPGVRLCDVAVKEKGGAEVTKQVAVEVPPYNRLTAALVPHAVVADGKSEVRLDVLYDLGGADVAPDRIRVVPSAGAITFQRASRGLYTYRYVAPAGIAAATVSFAISVAGDPAASSTAVLSLGLPPPARLVITPPQQPLRAGSGAAAAIQVLALDAAGMGLPGLEIHATANGDALPAASYRGGGQYEVPFPAPATYPPGGLVELRAVASDAGGATFGSVNFQLEPPAAPRSVTPRLSPSPVPADGATEARLVLDLRDEAGMPLEHAQLISVASHGTLGKVKERGGGLYEQTYRAPEQLPDGEVTLRVMDGSGRFERSFPIPLRTDPRRLLAGPTAGYTLSPGVASGSRAGAELWVPFRLGEARLGAGAAVGFGTASRAVSAPSLGLRSVTEATFVPMSLKLGYELYAGRRLSATAGAGVLASWARFRSTLASGTEQGLGLGWMGFVDLGWAAGPGLGVVGLSYGAAPVSTADYRIDPGGLSLVLGYRVGLL